MIKISRSNNSYLWAFKRFFRAFWMSALLMLVGVSNLSAMSSTNIFDADGDSILMRNPSISADNKYILFSFYYLKNGGGTRAALVLYDTVNDIISPFPLPRDVSWHESTFSPDGRYLAVAGSCLKNCPKGMSGGFTALIDMQSDFIDEKNKSVVFKLIDAEKGQFYENPAFSPDGKFFYYVEYKVSVGDGKHSRTGKPSIKRFAIDNGERKTLYSGIENPVSVRSIVDLNPLNNGGFIVNAIFPRKVTKKLEKEKRIRRGHGSSTVYLRPDHDGSLLTESSDYLWAHKFTGIKRVSVSSSGRIIFSDRSPDQDVDPKTGYFNYDLFVVDDGMLRQLTHIRKLTSEYSISPDGSTIAALVNDVVDQRPDIWVIDASTGKGKTTGLRDKLLKLMREQYPNK